jgi:hypothetical protein
MYEARVDPAPRRRALSRGLTLARGLATVSVLGWSFVAIGIALRLVRFADNRALWIDEAMLSLNLLERSFADLLQPLDHTQAAPPGFLLLEKLAVLAFGETEYALRVVPLVAGVLAVILFRQLTARAFPGLGGLVALALFVVAEPLVYFATEVKQYSVDVLAAVALFYVASEPLLTGRLTGRRAAALTACGALAVSVSHASVFVLAGIAAALALGQIVSDGRPSPALMAMAASWLVSFAIVFLLFVDNTTDVRAALALGETEAGSPLRTARRAWRAFAYPAPFARTGIALAVLAAVLGAYALARRRFRLLAALTLTAGATVCAALAGWYPFYSRFILFLVPVVFLLVGAGVQELREATAGRIGAVWIATLGLLVMYPAGVAARNVIDPPGHEEIKGVLTAMEGAWRPGDTLYLSNVTQSPLAYYAECEECDALDGRPGDDLRRVVLSARTSEDRGLRSTDRVVVGDVLDVAPYEVYASNFAPFRGESRVWFLFTSAWRRSFATYALNCLGRRLESFEARNAAAYLYDLSGPRRRAADCLRG